MTTSSSNNKNIVDTLLQVLNNVLHYEPISFMAERAYWWFLFVVVCPIVGGVGQFLLGLWDLITYVTGRKNATIEMDDNNQMELAVLITGCDSGFGKALAMELLSTTNTIVVFCGCLSQDSFQQYKSLSPRAIPLKMDITNDKEVSQAYEAVCKWIRHEEDEGTKRRYFHALVNNAGIGSKGLIDWFEMSDVERVMNVNFLGMVRTVKAFMPLLKQQQPYADARIINMVSVAGLFSGTMLSVLYESSKAASEAFTSNLRREMQLFNVKVISLNPGVFETPMYKIMEAEGKGLLCQTWKKLSKEKQQEYGQDFFQELYDAPVPPAWNSNIVVQEMKQCVLLKNPPDKIIPGIDARFVLTLIGKLPVWLSNWILNHAMGPHTIPAMMTKKKKQETKSDKNNSHNQSSKKQD